MKIVSAAKNDEESLAAYFTRVVLAYGKLTDTPMLAFVVSGDTLTVEIITKPGDTLKLPDDIQMMGQWRGEWKSDYFSFTAGQLKRFVTENPGAVYYPRQWGMPDR